MYSQVTFEFTVNTSAGSIVWSGHLQVCRSHRSTLPRKQTAWVRQGPKVNTATRSRNLNPGFSLNLLIYFYKKKYWLWMNDDFMKRYFSFTKCFDFLNHTFDYVNVANKLVVLNGHNISYWFSRCSQWIIKEFPWNNQSNSDSGLFDSLGKQGH